MGSWLRRLSHPAILARAALEKGAQGQRAVIEFEGRGSLGELTI